MADRQSTCTYCGNQFSFAIGRGKDRKTCGRGCAKASRLANIKACRADWPTCCVEGCERKIRSAIATYCEAHYYRIRRNGTLALRVPKATIPHSHGYVLEYSPGHWLSLRLDRNHIYQHRRVYFDAHGEGPFECHWCGVAVTWGDMHVDHVNEVRDDNARDNLVASCPACNQKRGHTKIRATHRARSLSKVDWRGESLTLGQWAGRIGISRASLRFRLKAGWPIDRAMTEGRGKTGPQAISAKG